jgi:hypothetical protein
VKYARELFNILTPGKDHYSPTDIKATHELLPAGTSIIVLGHFTLSSGVMMTDEKLCPHVYGERHAACPVLAAAQIRICRTHAT